MWAPKDHVLGSRLPDFDSFIYGLCYVSAQHYPTPTLVTPAQSSQVLLLSEASSDTPRRSQDPTLSRVVWHASNLCIQKAEEGGPSI